MAISRSSLEMEVRYTLCSLPRRGKMCGARSPAYVDSTIRKLPSPGPMGRVWLQWNFPSRLASASTQGPTPTFGERGTRHLCRSEDIFVKSVSPSTFSGVPETKVISPTCTPSTCCMGSCFPCGQASYLGGVLLVGNGQQAGVSVICAHTGVTFLPSLLCLSDSILSRVAASSAVFSLLHRLSIRGNPQPTLRRNHWCPPTPLGFLGSSWQAHSPEGREASLGMWILRFCHANEPGVFPTAFCQPPCL